MNSSEAEALYDDAPCGLLSTQHSGLIVRANRTICRWLDLPAEALVQKRRFQDLLTVGCRIFHQTHWMPLLQMQGSVAEVQLELQRNDKETLHVLVNAVRREAGDDMAILLATDRRTYERELLLARKRAEDLLVSERKAQEALQVALSGQGQEARERADLAEQLIGIVSHDLRTPLHAVLLGASLLTSSGLTHAQGRTVHRIISASTRATRLISDLLDFTQARLGGGLRVERVPIDLHALATETVEELRLASPGREIDLVSEGDGRGAGDPDRLAQVLTNLVSNALTYGAAERPIVVKTWGQNQSLRLEVQNQGEAIPAELLPHLFEPLRRGEQQVKKGSRSVGLGLYIVQQIAAAHGAEVTVTSDAANGTRFVLTIPPAP
jgi:phosphoserine phosphatase RsbU/P